MRWNRRLNMNTNVISYVVGFLFTENRLEWK